jgi:type VII secretion protein EccB
MQTRREQVRAYRFVTRRIVSAMVSGEPETIELPMRRLGLAMVGSVIVAALALGIVGAYGLKFPGGSTPDDNSLVIEKDTGARYVYSGQRLYPVLNYASARLILGVAAPQVQSLSRASLRGLARSNPVGIVDAPDSLPASNALLGLPWSMCSAPRDADSSVPAGRLLIGTEPGAGDPLGNDSLLVTVPGDADKYLLWHDHRLRISGNTALAALGLAAVTPTVVTQALINATTAGPDLTAARIDNAGQPSGRQIAGEEADLGAIYHDDHGQHYVMTAGGLSAIGAPMAELLLAGGGDDTAIPASAVGAALSTTRVEPAGFPDAAPHLRTVEAPLAAVCAIYQQTTNPDEAVELRTYPSVPADLAPPAADGSTQQVNNGIRTADTVAVPGGRGALIRALPEAGAEATGATVYLITDRGIKYALATGQNDALTALGYTASQAVGVPAALLSLVPSGPTLDRAAAVQEAGAQSPLSPTTPAISAPSTADPSETPHS